MFPKYNPLFLLPLACATLASASADAQPQPDAEPQGYGGYGGDTVVTKYEVVYTTIAADNAGPSPPPTYNNKPAPQPQYEAPKQEKPQQPAAPAPKQEKPQPAAPAPQENKAQPTPQTNSQPSDQTAPKAGATQYTSDSDFKQAILAATNKFRSQHSAAPLTWNDSLASYAQNHCNGCQFAHTGGPTGENLASGYSDATASIDTWGNERDKYNYASGGFDHETGHFTQLVWKATTSVGCGKKQCGGANGTPGWYVVCEYYPAGNVIGAFQKNVSPPSGGATSGGSKLKARHILGGSILGRRHVHA